MRVPYDQSLRSTSRHVAITLHHSSPFKTECIRSVAVWDSAFSSSVPMNRRIGNGRGFKAVASSFAMSTASTIRGGRGEGGGAKFPGPKFPGPGFLTD